MIATARAPIPMRTSRGQVLEFVYPDMSNDQESMVFDEHRTLWVGTGTKTGKTTAFAVWLSAGIASGERCAWVGPYHKRTRTGFDHIAKAFTEAERRGVARVRGGNEMRIEIPGTGGVLECFSGDSPNSIFGEGFNRVVVDEATRMGAAVLPAVLSTVTATGGKVRFAFNLDQGRKHWALQGFLNAKTGADPNQGHIFLRTDQSPYVAPETIAAMKAVLPDRVFRALYMGEIQEDGAGVFRNVPSVHGGEREFAPTIYRDYVIGLDLARKGDYTVAIVMDAKFKHVVAFERWHNEPWLNQADKIAALAKHWNNAVVVPDGTGIGDVMIAALGERNVRMRPVIITGGHGVTATGVPKTTLIQNLIVEIENRGFTFPAELEVLTNELQNYEYDTTAAGQIVYGAPDGMHDDCVIALALTLWGCKSAFMGVTEFVPTTYDRRGGF